MSEATKWTIRVRDLVFLAIGIVATVAVGLIV